MGRLSGVCEPAGFYWAFADELDVLLPKLTTVGRHKPLQIMLLQALVSEKPEEELLVVGIGGVELLEPYLGTRDWS